MQKKPIIISTDPGIDDAVAIALALFSEKLDVKLICPIFGNVSLEYTKQNLEKLITFFEKDTRIVSGSNKPLLRKAIDASNVHGKTGMDGYPFPDAKIFIEDSVSGVEAMHQVINSEKGKTTLVGIGPLTDIALLIHLYPQDLDKIEQVVLMGGSLGRGNYGVLSEFNFAADPEAAKIVFDSGLPIQVAPMEVGRQAKIMPNLTEKISHAGRVGDMFYNLFSKYRSGSFSTGLSMYDALAIALIVEPSMFDIVETRVEIETVGSLTAGASLIDLKGYLGLPSNAEVAINVDTKCFEDWFENSISAMI